MDRTKQQESVYDRSAARCSEFAQPYFQLEHLAGIVCRPVERLGHCLGSGIIGKLFGRWCSDRLAALPVWLPCGGWCALTRWLWRRLVGRGGRRPPPRAARSSSIAVSNRSRPAAACFAAPARRRGNSPRGRRSLGQGQRPARTRRAGRAGSRGVLLRPLRPPGAGCRCGRSGANGVGRIESRRGDAEATVTLTRSASEDGCIFPRRAPRVGMAHRVRSNLYENRSGRISRFGQEHGLRVAHGPEARSGPGPHGESAMAVIPEPRVEGLCRIYKPKKVTHGLVGDRRHAGPQPQPRGQRRPAGPDPRGGLPGVGDRRLQPQRSAVRPGGVRRRPAAWPTWRSSPTA